VPASAYVVIESVSLAVRETLLGFESGLNLLPESIEAVVRSLTMLIETPAPMPTVVASSSLALARAVLSTEAVEERVRGDPFRESPGGPGGMIWVLVVKSAIVSASEPAIPTLPPPPPDVAAVLRV